MADAKKTIGAITRLNLGKIYFSEIKLLVWALFFHQSKKVCIIINCDKCCNTNLQEICLYTMLDI